MQTLVQFVARQGDPNEVMARDSLPLPPLALSPREVAVAVHSREAPKWRVAVVPPLLLLLLGCRYLVSCIK